MITKAVLWQSLTIYLLYNSITTKKVMSATATFVVKPGGGEEYITTPVGRNVTLECSAINTSNIGWTVNGVGPQFFDSELSGLTLHQGGPIRASTGKLTSTLMINGTVQREAIEICCVIAGPQQCCTNLIVYDRPASPENIAVQRINTGFINITWDTESVAGIDQYYNINFTSNMSSIRSTKPSLSLNASIHDVPCGTSLLITAVNGAGKSSPSTFILPPLPDIAPVTSLEHQVWKVDGDIMVRVSFEPAETCIYYPVENYLLVLKSPSGKLVISLILGCNETETFLKGLEDNKMYTYSITAINTIGNATTDSEKFFVTSDVQNVTAIEVDEYTVKVRCCFINGSDAQGCLVVFNSSIGQVDSQRVVLYSNSIVWEVFTLDHPVSCYNQVLAFDIEAGGNISDLAVKANVMRKLATPCPLASQESIVLILTSAAIASIIFMLALILVIGLMLQHWNKRRKQVKRHWNEENSTSTIHPAGVTSGPSIQCSRNFQMKPNKAYEFLKANY